MVWEDQGLWFTLILNSIAVAVMAPIAYVLYVKKGKEGDTVLKRVLCPNRQGRIHENQTQEPGSSKEVEGSAMFVIPTVKQIRTITTHIGAEEDGVLAEPRVVIFSFFLKMCVLLFGVGAFFTLWLVPIYATDSYVIDLTQLQDPRDCRDNHNKSSDCGDSIYCVYYNSTGKCEPKKSEGLVDFSIQNVTPKNFRMYLVAIFAVGFAVALAFMVHTFLSSMKEYARFILPLQAKHCEGTRVVIVRGIPVPDKIKIEKEAEEKKEEKKDDDKKDKKKKKQPTEKTVSDEEYITQFKTDFISDFPDQSVILDVLTIRKTPDDYADHSAAMNDLQDALLNAVAEERVSDKVDEETGEKKPIMMKVPPKMKEARCTEHYEQELRTAVEDFNEDIKVAGEQDFTGAFLVNTASPKDAFDFIRYINDVKGGCTSKITASIAGEPENIQWENSGNNKFTGWVKFLIIILVFIVLVFFWSIPVAFLGSLDSLGTLPGIGFVFQWFTNNVPTTIRGILQAYLPVIVLAVFNIVLPPMIRKFALISGAITRNEVEVSMLVMLYIFMVMSGVVLQAALQGGMFQLMAVIQNPTQEAIFALIVAIVSPAGGFWYAKVITAGILGRWIFALQLGPVITSKLLASRAITQKAYDLFFLIKQPSLVAANPDGTPGWPLPVFYAHTMVVLSIGIFFHITVPLLCFFVFVYFLSTYIVFHGIVTDASRPVGYKPEERLTDFSLPVRWMNIILNLYCVAAFGTTLVTVMKEVWGATAISVLCLVIVVGCHIHFYRSCDELLKPEILLVSVDTAPTSAKSVAVSPKDEGTEEEKESEGEEKKEEENAPAPAAADAAAKTTFTPFQQKFLPPYMTTQEIVADDLVAETIKTGNTDVIMWAHPPVEEEEKKEEA